MTRCHSESLHDSLSCVVQPSGNGAALTGRLMEDTSARRMSPIVAVGSVRLAWRDSEWQRVIFSDESRFSLGGDAQRIRVWRHRGQHRDERCVVTPPEDLVSLHLHPYRTICRNCVRMFKLHGMDYHRTPLGTSTAPYRDVWGMTELGLEALGSNLSRAILPWESESGLGFLRFKSGCKVDQRTEDWELTVCPKAGRVVTLMWFLALDIGSSLRGMPILGSLDIGSSLRGMPILGSPYMGSGHGGTPIPGSLDMGSSLRGSPYTCSGHGGTPIPGSLDMGSSLRGMPIQGSLGMGSSLRGMPIQGSLGRGSSRRGTPIQGSLDMGSSLRGRPIQGSLGMGSSLRGTPIPGSLDMGSSLRGMPIQGSLGMGSSLRGTPIPGSLDMGSSLRGMPIQGSLDMGSSLRGRPILGSLDMGSSLRGMPIQGSLGIGSSLRGTPIPGSLDMGSSLRGRPILGSLEMGSRDGAYTLLVQHHWQTAAPRRTTCTRTVTTTVLNTTSPSPKTAVVSYQTVME
ncbi:hypothetical protein NFI96_003175 [Prochilodus magdalenae]|nr:hypothetical protein NFI96_003175 [Prochilodus magdalenae]